MKVIVNVDQLGEHTENRAIQWQMDQGKKTTSENSLRLLKLSTYHAI